MGRITKKHSGHCRHTQTVLADIRYRDTVAYAAVHDLRLYSNDIGLLRTGFVPK